MLIWFYLAALIFSAVLLSRALFSFHRLTTLGATVLVLVEVQWLLATWLVTFVPRESQAAAYVAACLGFLILSGAAYYRQRQPVVVRGFGRRDSVVLIVIGLVAAYATVISQHNGLQGTDFVLHGFYNGDVVTFGALVSRALILPRSSNPFAGGGELEYPTLLHRAFANALVFGRGGLDWLHFWPLLTLLQVVVTIPLFFLVWDTVLPPPARGELWLGLRRRALIYWLQGIVTVGVLTLAWDNYVYPQSHFFLTASFLLLAALLSARAGSATLTAVVAALTTLVLLSANAVTGTAALALFGLVQAIHFSRPGEPLLRRISMIGFVVLLIATYLAAIPGNAAFGPPHFSYTAANDMLRLTPWLALLLVGAALQLANMLPQSLGVVGLSVLGLLVFIFSSRDIVVANASRFIYHALLVGFPLLVRPAIRVLFYLRYEFILSLRQPLEHVFGLLLLLTGLGLLWLPNAASIAAATDNLLRQDEQRISFQRREVLWWLADHTAPESVIIASPSAPWDIPLFTGRSLLRASYPEEAFWLSRNDHVLQELKNALAGDATAQQHIRLKGDYLVLTTNEQAKWSLTALPVFATREYRVYQLK